MQRPPNYLFDFSGSTSQLWFSNLAILAGAWKIGPGVEILNVKIWLWDVGMGLGEGRG